MKRRALLQLLASIAASVHLPARLRAQGAPLRPADELRIRSLADVVLPGELGPAAREAVVGQFFTWLREYRAGAETDHGYGFPRLRRTGPHPAAAYTAQLDDLDAHARANGRRFADLPADEQRPVVETAMVAAGIDRLPPRPDGRHVAADLMGFYFNGIDANDLCYRARIGRDRCRTLDGSENRPPRLESGGR